MKLSGRDPHLDIGAHAAIDRRAGIGRLRRHTEHGASPLGPLQRKASEHQHAAYCAPHRVGDRAIRGIHPHLAVGACRRGDLAGQCVLVLEVIVDRAFGQIGRRRDLVDADCVYATRAEQRLGRRQNGRAIAFSAALGADGKGGHEGQI